MIDDSHSSLLRLLLSTGHEVTNFILEVLLSKLIEDNKLLNIISFQNGKKKQDITVTFVCKEAA